MPDKVKVSCLQCGATNNFPLASEGKTVVCGRCKTPLPWPGVVLEPSAEQVSNLVRNAALPVLIDFYSPTCMPCRVMHSIVDGLARRRAGDLMVVRVETGLHPDLAGAFRIQSVPTFVLMKKGYEMARVSGAMDETDFGLWVASKS